VNKNENKKITSSGIEVPLVLTSYEGKSKGEKPGVYPFTRGVHSSM